MRMNGMLRGTALLLALLPGAALAADGGWQHDFDSGASLSLGGSARVRTFNYAPVRFGMGGTDDGFTLYRGQLSADLRWAMHWQAFAELGVYDQTGRKGGPGGADRSGPDLHQAYLAWNSEGHVLRAGRQEMPFGSSRVIGVRDGQNIRQSFDGVRAARLLGERGRIDAIAVRPVQTRTGGFDDRPDHDMGLWGIYAALAPSKGAPLKLDLYWLGYQREAGRFAVGTGREYRNSLGTRMHGKANGWDWNNELIWQTGRFGSGDVRAWTVSTDNGYTFADAAWTPRLGLKADVASGDRDPNDGRLDTFNAMFPRAPYFSESSLLAPANLIDLQPELTVNPTLDTQWTLGWQFAWKHRRADGIYTTPTPLVPLAGTAGTSRWIGHQLKLQGAWQINPQWEARLDIAHFEAGAGLRQAGGRDVDFVSTTLEFTW